MAGYNVTTANLEGKVGKLVTQENYDHINIGYDLKAFLEDTYDIFTSIDLYRKRAYIKEISEKKPTLFIITKDSATNRSIIPVANDLAEQDSTDILARYIRRVQADNDPRIYFSQRDEKE
jgi:hypothetical protein